MTMLLCSAAMSAAERIHLFETDTLNGCYIDRGIVRLHKELPSQTEAENLVIACAKPIHIFFQEDVFARKAGARSDELVQIKKDASEYTPQNDDPEAKCGYIDYTKLAAYQYHVQTPGEYTVWFRVWVPSVANWQFSVFDDQGGKHEIDLKGSIPAAKKWFWKKGFTTKLDQGNHQIQIVQAMYGKRVSSILLTRDPAYVPQGDMPVSVYQKISRGTVQFKTAAPDGLLQWEKLTAQTQGSAVFQISVNGGKDFSELVEKDLRKYSRQPVTLKLILTRENGIEPEAKNIQAVYQYDEKQFCRITAGDACYIFSRANGALSGIINTVTKTEIQPAGVNASMFSLLLKTSGRNDKRYLDMRDARFVSLKQRSPEELELLWEFPADRIKVFFTVTAEKEQLVWQVKVDNRHPTADVIEVEGPVLSELRISENPASDTLVWPFSAGEFIPFPAEKGEFSITYPDHAGLPFAILTSGRESFYYGCHDKKLLITSFTSASNASSNAVTLKICRRHRIPAGESKTDTFVTAVLNGSWHKGADLYREYFYSVYPKNAYRPWLRNSDAWMQGSACGHTGLMKQYKDYTAFQYGFKWAAFHSVNYIQHWGSTFNGACPAYYLPRLDKGGEKMFAEQMKYWRDQGCYTGHYYFANGIAPYYVLTDLYFGVPWSKYPEEYRPPTFEWFVRNRDYISDSATVNEAELRRKTEQINEMHRRKQIAGGNYEESTGYIALNWRNGEYPEFLKKWIKIYVSKYHCNTAYLDTFAFCNALPDFNPHLKSNGEGDKPMYKMKFLNEMMADMRKIEPDFCALTEGIGDVFGTHLYFLLSGFARNTNIFRYTLPDQILFEGSCNAMWTKPLTHKSILQAFLCGNRFDLVIMYPETYYMLKLRQQISPFLNLAVFDDVRGITVPDPAVKAFAHRILPETASIIDGGGTKAITLTIANEEGKSGKITYELPRGFNLKRAMICELYKDPQPLKYSLKDGKAVFDVPAGTASAVILIDTLRGMHRFTASAEQPAPDRVAVKVCNFTETETEFTAAVGTQRKKRTVPGGDSEVIDFSFRISPGDFKILPVAVTAPGMEKVKRIISVGDSGSRIPMPELSARKSGKDLILDFEETVYSKKAAASGKRGFLLEGNGKFRMHKIPLDLVPNAHYEMTARIRKSAEVSPKPSDCFAMIAFYTKKEKKLVRLAFMGGNVVNDDKFHSMKVEFDTPDNLHNPGLFIYNSNSTGNLSLDDVKITEISRAMPAPAVSPAKTGKKTERVIPLNPGETELDPDVPLKNKQVIKLKGNGKYLQRMIRLDLKPGRTYRLSFMIRKGFEVSKVGHENMAGVFNYTKDGKLERYLILAESIPGDRKFHRCQGTFTVPDTVHNSGFYIYNRNTTDTVTVGDIQLTEIVP